MPKITIAESNIRQALEGIECPSHYKSAAWNEWQNGYLDFIVEQVLESKYAETVIAAIQYLLCLRVEQNDEEIKVNLADLEKNSSNKSLYKKVDQIIGKPADLTKKGDPSREFGIRGHTTIPKLFSGCFIRLEKQSPKEQRKTIQEALNFDGELNFSAQNRQEIKSPQERVTLNHIKKLQILWRKVIKRMGTDMFPSHTTEYEELTGLMLAVFGDDLRQLLELGKKSREHQYLTFLTVLTWVTAILRYRNEGTTVLFKEIRLFPYYYDVSLGRIDALEVVSIDGQAPNQKQVNILERLADIRYDSVGHLIFTLVQRFGKKLTLKIHDWKFAVGDGDNGMGKSLNIIHFNDVQSKPFQKHLSQMERYLSTSMISYGAVANYAEDSIQLWGTEDFTISGEIHYFFPSKVPLSHRVDLTAQEKKESFAKIAANYTDGEYRRKFLNVSESWLTMAINLSTKKQEKPKIATRQQLYLPGIVETTGKINGVHHTGKISKLIKNSVIRKWLDTFECVEDDGTPIPKLHVDRFYEAIAKGHIHVGKSFDFATGGPVSCFMPDHIHRGKSTPSFHFTWKNGGGFKCFGTCGISGKIARGSIPKNFEGRVQTVSKRLSVKAFKDIEAFHLSERHTEIMTMAQRTFQNQFLDSPGATYLKDVRRLYPELSMSLGAGYANEESIHRLLDFEVTYDELIEFGFVGIGHGVKEYGRNNTMVEILKKRGFKIDEILRLKEKTVDGEVRMVPALPYLVLNNTVTYPLDINHRITSFYGRVADKNCPKDFAHIKTSPKGVPQGGFNLTRAMEYAISKARNKNEPPQVLITEAAIDADTMFQFGDLKEAGALVGVNNHLLYQILALFPGIFITALNWDKSNIVDGKERGMAGQRNTIRFTEFLKTVNFDYPVYDFTQAFVKKVPDFNDLNAYWKKVYEDYWERKLLGADKLVATPFDVLFNKVRIL